MPSQMIPDYMATQVDVINSNNVASKVVRDLKLADSPGTREQFMEATEGKGDIKQWLGEQLLKKLSVEPSRDSSVIAITFSGANPQFDAEKTKTKTKTNKKTNFELR